MSLSSKRAFPWVTNSCSVSPGEVVFIAPYEDNYYFCIGAWVVHVAVDVSSGFSQCGDLVVTTAATAVQPNHSIIYQLLK